MNDVTAKNTNDKTETRTTMTLSLTASDKKALKQIALNNGITVASLVHEWIAEYDRKTTNNAGK